MDLLIKIQEEVDTYVHKHGVNTEKIYLTGDEWRLVQQLLDSRAMFLGIPVEITP